MATKSCIKISVYIKKIPTISQEQFQEHWRTKHARLALENPAFMKYIRKYNQVYITPEDRQQALQLGIPVLEYDGVGEMWFDTLDDYMTIMKDEAFVKHMTADTPLFAQPPGNVQISRDYLIYEVEHGQSKSKL